MFTPNTSFSSLQLISTRITSYTTLMLNLEIDQGYGAERPIATYQQTLFPEDREQANIYIYNPAWNLVETDLMDSVADIALNFNARFKDINDIGLGVLGHFIQLNKSLSRCT